MAMALRGFFHALARAIEVDPSRRERIAIHFVGTSYASGDRAKKTVEPIAREFGVDDCVTEHPQRIPYFEALRCLLDAHALFLPGSDDPTYAASKLMPCLFAQKAMLAVFHENSPVVATMRKLGAGTAVTFRADTTTADLGERILNQWFHKGAEAAPIVSQEQLIPYGAREMTRKLVEIFGRVAASQQPSFSAKAD